MKNTLILLIILGACILAPAQIYPLRTNDISLPKDSYVKDIDNELNAYEGTWTTSWGNKTLYITFKKIKYYKDFLNDGAYYQDLLVANFKVIDNATNNVIIDNSNIPDNNPKLYGSGIRKLDQKYSMIYLDKDLCGLVGNIRINFTDSSKNKLEWWCGLNYESIDKNSCYYGKQPSNEWPRPFPNKAILAKQ
ncbi:hypothetical protein HZP25_15605 [Elizabethkingia anophelis]|nr:hypothetical protein [Elizabethkingia anophelis]